MDAIPHVFLVVTIEWVLRIMGCMQFYGSHSTTVRRIEVFMVMN